MDQQLKTHLTWLSYKLSPAFKNILLLITALFLLTISRESNSSVINSDNDESTNPKVQRVIGSSPKNSARELFLKKVQKPLPTMFGVVSKPIPNSETWSVHAKKLAFVAQCTGNICNGGVNVGQFCLSDGDCPDGGNNAPTNIGLTATAIDDTATSTNATVGTLSTTDADGGDSHIYSLVTDGSSANGNCGAATSDDDNASFNISGTSFRTASSLAAGSYNICLQTYDGTTTFQKGFSITVNNTSNSDGTLTAAVGVSEPVGINTTIDTAGEAVNVFDFTLTDGGSGDTKAMTVSQVVVNVSGTSIDSDRNKVTWRLNGNDASNVTGVYSAINDTITFSGLSISIADGASEVYTVNAYYNDNTGITDGRTFVLSIDGDTNVTVGGSGTQMGATAAVTNGAGGSFDVVATTMTFSTQPAGSVSGAALTTQPVVTAQDAFGNTDTGFTETITLTEASAGSLTGDSQAAVAGVATFTSVDYTATADQQSFTLTANDQDGVGSNLSTVNANAVTSDVVATQLIFDTQPIPTTVQSGIATNFTTVPVISARDANSVVDTGYSTSITLAEVNGAGSATITGTGDTDGSGATVSITPSSGVSTFTGMQITYTASGGSSENFNLQASSGGLSTASSSQLTGLVADSDGSLTSASGVSEPVGLDTTVDTVGEAVDIFDFTLTDGGTADGLAMTASQVVVNVSGTSIDSDRNKVTWRLNGNDASNVTGVYSAISDTITFSGLSISVTNGQSEVYTVNAYYNDNTGITDGRTFVLSVDGDTDVTVGGSGTQMGTTAAVTNGAGGSFDVVATTMTFSTQPAGSVSGSALTTQPVVIVQDAFGNTDTGFTETITLTEASAGSLTGDSQAAVAGVATFSSVDYTATADQQSFILTANDQDGVGSNLSTVNANAVTSDVVATKLVFDTQPSPLSVQSAIATNLTTVPVVSAQDANNIIDTGYSTDISLAEVNGAGSATISGTGDTDGSGNTVTITPSSGVATFTGMQVTYTASGGADENFNLQASSGGLLTANSSQFTAGSFDTDTSVTGASGVIEPVALPSVVDTSGEALGVLDFTVTDGGTSDSKPTLVSAIRLHVSGTAAANKFSYLLNGPDANNIVGNLNVNVVTFSGLTVSIANGQAEEYTVSVYYNDNTSLTENQTLILSTDGDTDFTLAAGSTAMANTAPIDNSTGSTVDITAIALKFATQPAGAISGTALTTQPIVKAIDAFSNTDTDFTELVTLTEASAGSLTGDTKAALAGVATFSALIYSATSDQQSFTLTANDQDNVGINMDTVSANSLVSDVVATKLVFEDYLTPLTINSEQSPADNSFVSAGNAFSETVIVNAENAAGIIDTDYIGAVTLTQSAVAPGSSFSITTTGDTDASTSTITRMAANGQVSFSNLNIDYKAASASDVFGLNASDNVAGTSNAVGSNIDINIAPYVKEKTDSFGPLSFDEDVKTIFDVSDIEVFDADNNNLTVTFSVDRGLLFAIDGDSTQAGVSITGSNDNNGSQLINLSGSISNVNSFLSTDRFQYQTDLNDINSATLTVKANDSVLDGANVLTETLAINAINDTPVISGTPDTSVAEGGAYSFTPMATDVDTGDTKTFSITNKPAWADFDSATGQLSGTPGDTDVGVHSNIIMTVTDSGNLSVSLNAFDITVTNVNDAPVISGAANISVAQDSLYNFVPTVTDVDNGDTKTFSIVNKPSWANFNSATGELSGIPTNDNLGTYTNIVITVTDSANASDSLAAFSIAVTNVNDAPVISGTPSTTVAENSSYSFTPTVTDVDSGDTKTFSITNKPSWAAFNSTTGALTGTPDNDDVGVSSNIIITVRDSGGETASLPGFSITVTNVNDAPMISGTPLTAVNEGEEYTFTPIVEDIDPNSTLTFTIVNKPEWTSFNVSTGELMGTPDKDNRGITEGIVITVTDNDGLSASLDRFSLEVLSVNSAPNATDDSFEFERNEQNRYLMNVIDNDSDIDGDELTLTAVSSGIGQVVIENNQIILTVDSGFIGQVELDYSITDGNDEFGEASVQVSIRGAVDSVPVITVPDDIEINAVGLYSQADLGIATAVSKNGRPVPVSLLNGPLFQPGNNLAYWQATEEATGLTSIASQKVVVHPLISLSKDQMAIEGASVSISVLLNGEAPVYPLIIPFTISGSVDDNDYVIASDEVEIVSGTEALININIMDDSETEGDETLIVTLGDGNLGSKSTHTLTIVERNLAPEIALAMRQDGQSRQLVTPINGLVSVNADISDANNDIVTSQWQYDAELDVVDEFDNQLAFDPSNLANGIYSIRLNVTDDGEGNLSANQTLYFEVNAELPPLTDIDSDGDLIPDQQEGYSDTDQDGIPDYLDAIAECNVLPEQAAIQNEFLVEGDPGVCLRKGATLAAGETGGVLLTSTDLQSNVIASDDLPNVGGIFDYIASGLPVIGQNYRVVLPQRQPIPAGAVYRKYSDENGWTNFVEDSDNQLHSVAGQRGYCPPPASESWSVGLTEGHWCVQLTISDGGANDDDGIANGTIVDPGGVAVQADNNTSPQPLADSVRLRRNQTIIIDVLANDIDIDNDELSLGVVTSIFGTVTITADNQLHYQAQTDFVGIDTVTYSVSDGNGGTSSAMVSVEVFTNDAPQAVSDDASTDDRTAITLNVLANDSDIDGDTLTITSSSADVGLVVVNSDNSLTYTPAQGFNGLAIVSYQVTDSFNPAVTGQVNVQVTAFEGVTVTNKSKGGSMGMMILAMVMLLTLRQLFAKRLVGLATVFISLASFNASAEWFITGAVGKSTALENINSSNIKDLDAISFDNSDVSFRIGTGFNYDDFSFSLNYEQLGDTETVISGSTLNTHQFHQSVIDVAPKLVDGFSVQSQYRVWHNDAVNVAIGFGLLTWDLDYSSTLNGTTIERSDSGTDVFYTATLGYQVLTNVEVNMQATRYNLPFNDVNNLSVGISYSF